MLIIRRHIEFLSLILLTSFLLSLQGPGMYEIFHQLSHLADRMQDTYQTHYLTDHTTAHEHDDLLTLMNISQDHDTKVPPVLEKVIKGLDLIQPDLVTWNLEDRRPEVNFRSSFMLSSIYQSILAPPPEVV